MLNLKKDDLAKKLAAQQEISEAEAKRRIDATLGAVVGCLEDIAASEPNEKDVRGTLQIVGFGNFVVKHKAGRAYRNPQTGEDVMKPDTNKASFKEGKFLKDSINQ